MTDPTPTTADRITRVERAGLTFDVVDEGPLDGEPIVLLHGFPERATSWRLVVPALHEAGYRTLAPDQRGYSPGARPRRRRDYRLGELAADVVALIDRLGPDAKAHVVGHDWGAVVAWALALRHAKRVHTLTAVSVPHPAAYVDGLLRGQLVKSWYMAAFQLPFVPERLAGEGGLLERQLRGSGMTEDDISRFRTEIVEDGALPTALNWYRALPLTHPRATRGRVHVPTTMVWSDGDVAIGRWGVEHCEKYVAGHYRLVELEGVSHWIPTQAADALAQAILERVAGV